MEKNDCSERGKQTDRSGVTRRQKDTNGDDKEPSGQRRRWFIKTTWGKGSGSQTPTDPAGARVGDGVTSSGGGKGCDSRFPSSSPGVGS